MKKNFFVATLTMIFLAGSAVSAMALLVTFDFTDPNIDAPITAANSNEGIDNLFSWTNGLFTLSASANPGGDGQLYLDNITSPNVGIGVDDDAGGNDEEIEFGESVNLSIAGPATAFSLVGLELWDPNHTQSFPTNLNVTINGTPIHAAGNLLGFDFVGQSFDIGLSFDPGTPQLIGAGFYIGAATFDVEPVPEPATMLLFGTGLAGLVGSRMRSKKR